jgi:hypothetical protein
VPFELKLAPGESFARVRGWGKEDFVSTTAAMKTIADDARLQPLMPVLFDVRVDYLATPPEVASFATQHTTPLGLGRRRLALLVRRGAQFGVARVFASKAEAAGREIEVFAEEDLAIAWLKKGER